jgi:PAS domain S-box-containing protein
MLMTLVGRLTDRVGRIFRKRPSLSAGTMVFVLAMCLSLVGLDAWRTWNAREDDLRTAKMTSANLAHAVAQHADDSIRAADAVLVVVAGRIRQSGMDPDERERLHSLLVASAAELPQLIGLFVYDRTGTPLAGSIETNVDIADHAYFAFHRDHPGHALHIGRPVIDDANGNWSIPVSRRLDDPDGGFAGVVLASFDMDYFLQFYNTLEIGPNDAILLVTDNGTTLARRPFFERDVGKSVADSLVFRDLLPNAARGNLVVTSLFDHQRRLVSYRRLDHYPLVTEAALSEDDVLGPWRADARLHLIGVLSLASALGFLGYRLSRQVALRANAERSATEAAEAANHAAREAAAMRDHYRLLADYSTDMICRIGPDGLRQYVSPASRPLLGYEPEELVGRLPADLQHPDDSARIMDHLRLAIEARDAGSSTVTYRMRRKDDRYVWVEATLQILRDEATGEPTELITTVRDISGRMDAEARLRDAIESIDDGFILWDDAWRLIMCNGRYRALYQLSVHGPMPGMLMRDLLIEEARAGQHGPVQEPGAFAEAGLEAMRREGDAVEYQLADGRWILYRNRRMATGGWVGIRTDITAQKRRERELAESEARLEQQATSLAALATDLTSAKAEAENANRLKSEFLATMSHEIRTPMNGIIGMNALLLDTPLAAKQRQFAEAVRFSADALMVIINDILDVSKLEAGRVELEEIEFDFGRTVDDAVELMTPRAQEKGLSIEAIVAAGARQPLRGDPNRLRQVLLNLLSNAIKFTERGHVAISVDAETSGSDRMALRVEVRDTGIGVSDADKPKLFQKFQQADGSITRRFGGTGLGLNISAQLLNLMNGRIGIADRPGGGSIFWFELSLQMGSHRPGSANGNRPDVTPIADRLMRGSGHILLAEDNAINRDLATVILETHGYDVTIAEDGLEAVAAAARGGYDLILMDVQMPNLDGFGATRRIRALDGPAGAVPIVAMTANAMTSDRKLCLDAGMVDYVSKPISTKGFLATVALWIAPRELALAATDSVDDTRLSELEALLPRERMAQLVAAFVDSRDGSLRRLRHSAAVTDLNELKAEAHVLTATAGNLGARRLQRAAERLHAACIAGALDSIESLLAELEESWRETVAFFSRRAAGSPVLEHAGNATSLG